MIIFGIIGAVFLQPGLLFLLLDSTNTVMSKHWKELKHWHQPGNPTAVILYWSTDSERPDTTPIILAVRRKYPELKESKWIYSKRSHVPLSECNMNENLARKCKLYKMSVLGFIPNSKVSQHGLLKIAGAVSYACNLWPLQPINCQFYAQLLRMYKMAIYAQLLRWQKALAQRSISFRKVLCHYVDTVSHYGRL